MLMKESALGKRRCPAPADLVPLCLGRLRTPLLYCRQDEEQMAFVEPGWKRGLGVRPGRQNLDSQGPERQGHPDPLRNGPPQ
jgi:hypothetical protein